MVDPILLQLLRGFVDESQEICERITRDLLALEKAPRAPGAAGTFDDLARGLHTLKGSAATLGLDELADVAHRMEDVVAPLRPGASMPAPVADALLRSLDAWMSHLRATAAGAPTVGLAATSQLLEATKLLGAAEAPAPAASPASPSPVSAAAPGSPSPTTASGDSPSPVSAMAPDSPSPLSVGAPASPSPVRSSPRSEPPLAPAESVTAQEAEAAGEATWRVGTRQVAALLHDVERLREVRLRLEERQRELDKGLQQLARAGLQLRLTGTGPTATPEPPGTAAARAVLGSVSRGLSGDIDEASDIVASLEDGLKAISTQPMRTILEPLRRAVRDLCRASGKLATLSVVGGEVSLDRRLLESLRSPLVHLVRNAIDHGIEPPELREKRGKHAEGALVVRVEQQGNMLFIEVADDGGGIDLDRVREAALQRGLHTAAELQVLSPAQVQQLIFRPGFSTRMHVTEVSGRGVGLDIVRSQIQALSGHVEVQSVAGQGTRFVLSLPAELGSSAVLAVRCGEHQVGLPTLAVESSRSARSRDVNVGRRQLRYAYREELIPLHDLAALLGLRQPEVPRNDQPLLIVSSQGRRIALAVDEVLGDRELVIRPLPPEVRDVPSWQGAATLARGELVLIVRPEWLVAAGQVVAGPEAVPPRPRALVVDDSLTARAMHRAALEAGGIEGHTASNARLALEQLRRAQYDVVVSDLRMEEMDGWTLLALLRSRPETASLPVVLVSTLEGEAERKRAQQGGADAFLSKRECAEGRLLAEVKAVLQRRGGSPLHREGAHG